MTTPAFNSILFIAGNRDVERHVCENCGHAYWTAAFDTVMEKSGYLDFYRADQDILDRPEDVNRYPALFLGWLPAPFWTERRIHTVRNYPGIVLAEGPVPPALHDFFGVTGGTPTEEKERLCTVTNPEIQEFLTQNFSAFLAPGKKIRLHPKHIETREVRHNRWDFDFDPDAISFEDMARRLIRSLRIPYWNRLRAGKSLPNYRDNLYLLLFLAKDLEKGADPGEGNHELLKNFLDRLAPQAKGNLDKTLVSAIGQSLNHSVPVSSGNSSLNSFKRYCYNTLQKMLRAAKRQDILALKENDFIIEALLQNRKDLLENHVEKSLEFNENGFQFKRPLNISGIAKTVLALQALGRKEDADTLLENLLAAAFDREDGRIYNTTFYKDAPARRAKGYCMSPLLALALLGAVEDVCELPYIGKTFQETYGKDRIALWHQPPYTFHQYQPDGAIPLLSAENLSPALLSGKTLLFSFQAFSYMAFYHTMPPLNGPFTDCDANGAMLLESVLFRTFENMAKKTGTAFARVAPWPAGGQYCLTVRHDVDRIPDQKTFENLMAFETQKKLGVSWFWIFSRLVKPYIEKQESAGHEIALHAMKHTQKKEETRALSNCLSRQPKIYGECIHGGGGGEYWLGYPSVEAADNQGFDYAEGMSTLYDYPYRFPYLDEENYIAKSRAVCLSHSVSIDRNIEGQNRPWNTQRVQNIIANGFYLMVLNHPDQYLERLQTIVADMPEGGRIDWTCKQVADWWHATHTAENLVIRRFEDHSYEVLSKTKDIKNTVLRIFSTGAAYINGEKAKTNPFAPKGTDGYIDILLDLKQGEPVKIQIANQHALKRAG